MHGAGTCLGGIRVVSPGHAPGGTDTSTCISNRAAVVVQLYRAVA